MKTAKRSKNYFQLFCTQHSCGHSLMNNFNLSFGHSWSYHIELHDVMQHLFCIVFSCSKNHLFRFHSSFSLLPPSLFLLESSLGVHNVPLIILLESPLARFSDIFPPYNKILRLWLIALIPPAATRTQFIVFGFYAMVLHNRFGDKTFVRLWRRRITWIIEHKTL